MVRRIKRIKEATVVRAAKKQKCCRRSTNTTALTKQQEKTPATSELPSRKRKEFKRDNDSMEPQEAKATNSNQSGARSLISTTWNIRYSELCTYKSIHGDCNVPRGYEPNPTLGHWVATQRKDYQQLLKGAYSPVTEERIKMLNAIDFVWKILEPWQTRYAELRLYKTAHGDCNVPNKYKQNPKLGNWVSKQRQHYKLFVKGKSSPLTEQRVKLLNAVDFDWGVPTVAWTTRYAELRDYKSKHGDCNVTATKHPQLATWVTHQRSQFKLFSKGKPAKVTGERVRLLNAINFAWELRGAAAWETRYAELCEYKNKYGDCNVPEKYKQNPQLGKWVTYQRYQYKLFVKGKSTFLTDERVERLDAIGFVGVREPALIRCVAV